MEIAVYKAVSQLAIKKGDPWAALQFVYPRKGVLMLP